MDDVQFESLASVLEREGPLATDRALALMREAARALADAHAAGLLHCDLRPDSILVAADGRVLLAASPLARRQGALLRPRRPDAPPPLLPLYYPPEAARARPLDTRTDLFLLGAAFYQAIAGQPPFNDPDPEAQALLYICKDAPSLDQRVPGIPVLVNCLIQKLLRRDPDERYQSAQELLAVVERTERMLHKRQPARRAVRRPATASSVAEPAEGPGPKPPEPAERAKPQERPAAARARVAWSTIWQSKPFIYASAAGGFLLIVIAILLFSSGGRRPELALRGPAPPDATPAAKGETVKAEADKAIEQPKPKLKTSTPAPPDPTAKAKEQPGTSEPPRRKWEPIEKRMKLDPSKKGDAPPPPEPPRTAVLADELSLAAIDAKIHGASAQGTRYEPNADKDCIGYWFDDGAWVSWPIRVASPGFYNVEILFAAEPPAEGNEYVVTVGDWEVRGKVRNTGKWTKFETDRSGTVMLERPGECIVAVKPGKKKAPRAPLMNLRAVILRRVKN